MVSIDKAVLAKYSQSGKHFELYVDPIKAAEFRDGKEVSIKEVLAVEEIYKDARKAERATESSLEEIFGTTDPIEVAKQIIKKGEIQLTSEQRKKRVEEKRKSIVNIIAREAFNPQTSTPHPPQRIENAIEEAHISIDPFERAEDQVEKVLKAIRPLLPISMERLSIEVLIPAEYTGKVYGTLKNYSLEKEEWLPNGTLKAILKIPAGMESEIYDEINSMCKGQAELKRIKQGG